MKKFALVFCCLFFGSWFVVWCYMSLYEFSFLNPLQWMIDWPEMSKESRGLVLGGFTLWMIVVFAFSMMFSDGASSDYKTHIKYLENSRYSGSSSPTKSPDAIDIALGVGSDDRDWETQKQRSSKA